MRAFKSLFLGFCLVILLVALGLLAPRTQHAMDFIFKPGDICATFVFGGLHGLEPLLFAVIVEVLLFGSFFLMLSWAMDKVRNVDR